MMKVMTGEAVRTRKWERNMMHGFTHDETMRAIEGSPYVLQDRFKAILILVSGSIFILVAKTFQALKPPIFHLSFGTSIPRKQNG